MSRRRFLGCVGGVSVGARMVAAEEAGAKRRRARQVRGRA